MQHPRVVVIGAGPSGVTAAVEAARNGAQVTVISDGNIGGRAGWDSLLPSKVLLDAASHAHLSPPDSPAMARICAAMEQVAHGYSRYLSERLDGSGARVMRGKARFTGPNRLLVASEGEAREVVFDEAIIATGSVPVFPEGLKPDGRRVLAPRFVSTMRELPKSMLIVGGGVTGTEYAHAFHALGVDITWLVDERGVLPTYDRVLADRLVEQFKRRGMKFVAGNKTVTVDRFETGVRARLSDGTEIESETAFIAVGRRCDVEGLGLEAVGKVEFLDDDPTTGLYVDGYARTSIPHILAAGDVTGAPYIANKALAQAFTAGRASVGPLAKPRPLDDNTFVHAVFSDPEVAAVGVTPEQAQKEGLPVVLFNSGYDAVLKGHLIEAEVRNAAFITIVADARDERILGAIAFGPQASEVLASVALALATDAKLDDLATVFPATPTLTELAFIAARR